MFSGKNDSGYNSNSLNSSLDDDNQKVGISTLFTNVRVFIIFSETLQVDPGQDEFQTQENRHG